MYAKVFSSIFDGSMRGHSDLILVFVNILCHADQDGMVDRHWRAIADETGLPDERVQAALLALESPDTESRTRTDDGRRLRRIDPERDWGWQIINFKHYRALRNDDERREYMRNLMRNKRKQQAVAPVSNLLAPLANAEAEAEAEADKTKICPPKPDGSTDFGIFWAMYPRKEGKGNARMAFKKKKCSAIMAKIELAVERQKKSDQWQKDSGQFIPMPATWINQERWDDEGTAVPVIHKPRSDPKAAIRDRAIAEIMERLKTERLATPEESFMEIAARLALSDKYKDIPGVVDKAVWTLNYEREA